MRYQLTFVCLVLCISSCLTAKLPTEFSRCNLGSANFDECLKNAIQGAIKVLSKGPLPKYGIPTINPINIPEMTIGEGSSAVSFKQKYMNVNTYGYADGTVVNAHLDLKKKQISFLVSVPKFLLEGNYKVDGTILLFPVRGEGGCKFFLDKTTVQHTLSYDIVERKGKKFLDVKDYEVEIKTKKAQFQFDNLFDGRKDLSDAIHKIVNDNWEVVYEDVVAGYNKAYAAIFKIYAKNFFNKVPFTEVFPQ